MNANEPIQSGRGIRPPLCPVPSTLRSPVTMFRPAFRTILRQSGPAQRRTIANEASLNAGADTEFIKSRKAVEDHAGHSAELWRKITSVDSLLDCCLSGALRAREPVRWIAVLLIRYACFVHTATTLLSLLVSRSSLSC